MASAVDSSIAPASRAPSTSSDAVCFVVGSGKNAGKTVVLKHLMRRAETRRRGLVTIGNDGEGVDALDGRDKPRLWVASGDLVCTTLDCLLRATASMASVDLLPFTVGGSPLHVAEVRRAGEVELVGPDTASQLGHVVSRLARRGAETIFVDGALDRLSQMTALPGSGLVYVAATTDFASLEEMRRYLVHLRRATSRLPVYRGPGFGVVPRGAAAVIRDEEVHLLPRHGVPTPERLGRDRCTLYVHRPVTSSWLAHLGEGLELLDRVVLHDPWTLVSPEPFWRMCERYEVAVEIAQPFRLEGVFIAHAPGKGRFPGPRAVLEHLRESLGDLPVDNTMLAAEPRA